MPENGWKSGSAKALIADGKKRYWSSSWARKVRAAGVPKQMKDRLLRMAERKTMKDTVKQTVKQTLIRGGSSSKTTRVGGKTTRVGGRTRRK